MLAPYQTQEGAVIRDLLEIELSPPNGQGIPVELGMTLQAALKRTGILSKTVPAAQGRLLVQLINVDDDECRFAIQMVRSAGYRVAVTVSDDHDLSPTTHSLPAS